MKKPKNPFIEEIMREDKKKKQYAKKKDITLAQFQLNHCRYCKNKTTNLCEIRKNINFEFCCEYEENQYERRNIK
jgi:hypothetical protein